jgi:CDP-glucose 4,6-dehydratase
MISMNFNQQNVFAGKRVFLTGHTGFKGSWLALWLQRLGAEVTGYSLEPPTEPNHFSVADVRSGLAGHYQADIRDAATLEAAIRQADPDLVMHLAAQSVVRTSYEIPRETFEINVIGSIGVLDAIRRLEKPCAALMITSDKCYENLEQVWGYREEDAMGEHDPYGGSKGAAEIAIRSYRHSFFPVERIDQHGVRLASARAGNVIGGGDWTKDALIVDLIRSLEQHQPVRIRSPRARRPWQHVLQCLSGYLAIAERLLGDDAASYCSGWNIGPLPGNELPVQEVVNHFVACWGEGSSIDASDPFQPPEANILRLCIDKAIWKLGWHPCWSVFETLERTADWYRAYLKDPAAIRQVSMEQIEAYQQAMAIPRRSPLAAPH